MMDTKHAPGETMAAMLGRARARGVEPKTVIDVGASNGQWSQLALKHWPDASLLLIEADDRHRDQLDNFASVCDALGPGSATAIHAMASDHVGMGHFTASPDPFGGAGSDGPRPGSRQTPCTTIDHEVGQHGSAGPFLIKLDTHGYEVQILRGASRALELACALVVEAYTCTLQPGAVRFWELCQTLWLWGFVPTDIADVIRRPLDGRWWQTDFLFERVDVELVGEGRYR